MPSVSPSVLDLRDAPRNRPGASAAGHLSVTFPGGWRMLLIISFNNLQYYCRKGIIQISMNLGENANRKLQLERFCIESAHRGAVDNAGAWCLKFSELIRMMTWEVATALASSASRPRKPPAPVVDSRLPPRLVRQHADIRHISRRCRHSQAWQSRQPFHAAPCRAMLDGFFPQNPTVQAYLHQRNL